MGSAEDVADNEDTFAVLIDDFVEEAWKGTPTQLCEELRKFDSSFDLSPLSISKKLTAISNLLKSQYEIVFFAERSRKGRYISLKRD